MHAYCWRQRPSSCTLYTIYAHISAEDTSTRPAPSTPAEQRTWIHGSWSESLEAIDLISPLVDSPWTLESHRMC